MMKIVGEWAVLEGDTHISKWVEETGRIEHNAGYPASFSRFLKAGDLAVDVGAFIGDTTVPMAQLVGPTGKVLAFEPQPEAFACLVYNCRKYPWVTCYPFALGELDEFSTCRMNKIVQSDNRGASALRGTFEAALDGVWVSETELDLVLMNANPALIKVDVEGFEFMVLAGAFNVLNRARPVLIVETAVHAARYFHSDTSHKPRERLYVYLEDLGYQIDPPIKPLESHPQYDLIATPKRTD